jgi:hypothetical protein
LFKYRIRLKSKVYQYCIRTMHSLFCTILLLFLVSCSGFKFHLSVSWNRIPFQSLFESGAEPGQRQERVARPSAIRHRYPRHRRRPHNEQKEEKDPSSNPKEKMLEWDAKKEVLEQIPNDTSPDILSLETATNLRFLKSERSCTSSSDRHDGNQIELMEEDLVFQYQVSHPAWEFQSLDIIYPGLSKCFNNDCTFRNSLRLAIRQDIFETTPAYSRLSEKAASFLLRHDSSLQGSWKTPPAVTSNNQTTDPIRMVHTTKVLRDALGNEALSGDDLLSAVGSLCGPTPTTHFIDIVGVQDRRIAHSWHLDTGYSPNNSKTVLWGFPAEDQYHGCGVFSHLILLQQECHAPEGHPKLQPLVFQGSVEENFIVRPFYKPGNELLIYRDIDVLHSSPDIAYRTSVMRFM